MPALNLKSVVGHSAVSLSENDIWLHSVYYSSGCRNKIWPLFHNWKFRLCCYLLFLRLNTGSSQALTTLTLSTWLSFVFRSFRWLSCLVPKRYRHIDIMNWPINYLSWPLLQFPTTWGFWDVNNTLRRHTRLHRTSSIVCIMHACI